MIQKNTCPSLVKNEPRAIKKDAPEKSVFLCQGMQFNYCRRIEYLLLLQDSQDLRFPPYFVFQDQS